MTFDWAEFMKVASILAARHRGEVPASDDPTEEACQRTAISRVYYAAFHKTCEFLTINCKRSDIRQGSNAHTVVPRVLKDSKDREQIKIGNKLDNLRVDRNKADYDHDIPNARALTAKAITSATNILQLLESLKSKETSGL